jgi:hypothetical protein
MVTAREIVAIHRPAAAAAAGSVHVTRFAHRLLNKNAAYQGHAQAGGDDITVGDVIIKGEFCAATKASIHIVSTCFYVFVFIRLCNAMGGFYV